MLTVVQNSVIKHPELKSVVVKEHAPRYEVQFVDPTGIKANLVKYANSTFTQLLQSSSMKDKISIGRHKLDCKDDMLNAWFKDERTGRMDGVHYHGGHGRAAYTRSVLQIFRSILPGVNTPSSSSSWIPRESQRQQQQQPWQQMRSNRNRYTVPVNNKFDVLGN